MPIAPDVATRLEKLQSITVREAVPLASLTRFGIGGPATLVVEAEKSDDFITALSFVREENLPYIVVGGGTNLIVSDAGFRGVVLRYTGAAITDVSTKETPALVVEAGASLQSAVDSSIDLGMKGLETMTGIPGSVGGAVYGNAGAYGRSIHEIVRSVSYTDGTATYSLPSDQCEFYYRTSIFKRNKNWIVLSAELQFSSGDSIEMRRRADEIRTVRDAKYPPEMKCAGSIFKNCIFAQLPQAVQAVVPPAMVREGKVPSAWFLEQVNAKGMRVGDIQVASYHANLIYNDGAGTAADLIAVIRELKERVKERFRFEIEEEVQYVGFD